MFQPSVGHGGRETSKGMSTNNHTQVGWLESMMTFHHGVKHHQQQPSYSQITQNMRVFQSF